MHSRIEAIKAKGMRAFEPSNKEVFTMDHPESDHYRKSTSEIFVKANCDSLDGIKVLKARTVSRIRSVSASSDMSVE